MIEPIRSAPVSCERRAVPSRGQKRSFAGYSAPHVVQSFRALTLHALDAEDLIAHEHAPALLHDALAAHREGHAVAAPRVVHVELRVLAPDLRMTSAHRRIVRENPIAGFAAELDRARRREVEDVAHGAVGAEL